MAKKHEEPEKNEKEPAAPEAAKQAEAPKQPEGSKQKAESKQPDALEQAKAAQAQEHDQFLRPQTVQVWTVLPPSVQVASLPETV